jgi:hypothetical protein
MGKILLGNKVPAEIRKGGVEELRACVRFALTTQPREIIKPPSFQLLKEWADFISRWYLFTIGYEAV